MRNVSSSWVIVIIMLLLDYYVFQAIKTITQPAADKTKLIVYILYWTVSIAAVLFVCFFPWFNNSAVLKPIKTYFFAIVVGLFFAKLFIFIFLFIDDLRRFSLWIMAKFFANTEAKEFEKGNAISRSAFLSWVGVGMGSGLFGTLIYGFSNKYNYQLKRITLNFSNLPKGFDGLKLIQLSDIHAGSFQNKEAVSKGIDKILAEQADVILFTGDLVNDRADEMQDFMDIFSRLVAPLGVYSILGNHDYGDYVRWPSLIIKAANLNQLKKVHADLGWRLLLNEHVSIKRNNDEIALLGIENWGAKANFPKYGKMEAASKGTEKYPFKVLMSHDPSHWDAQVRSQYPDVDLMLSGHTHGMQFGIENPYFKWSPVQWVYKQWAGLYEKGAQKLYVNRGFGFIGYPGRVGVLPEITVITLKKSDI